MTRKPRQRHDGGKQRPATTALVVPGGGSPALVLNQGSVAVDVAAPALRDTDFETPKVGSVLTDLLAQCAAHEAAAALIPWFCDALLSPKSRRDYFRDLRDFMSEMTKRGVHPFHVTGDHVRLYKAALVRSGRKSATVARSLSVIRGTYEQFGKKGLVPWDRVGDIQSITAPEVEKNTTPELSEQEAIRLLEAPDASTLMGLRDFALLYTYIRTACRSSAIRNAKVGDLERTDDEWYVVVTEKGNKRRRVPMMEAGAVVLVWIDVAGISGNPESPLFPALSPDQRSVTPRPLSQPAVLNIVKKYGRETGLAVDRLDRRGICTHSLRKTAAMNALEHGANVAHVQQWLGHADIRTTQNYITYRETDAEAAARCSQIRPRQRR